MNKAGGMDYSLKTGIKIEIKKVVTFEDTAAKYGSGMIEVFASPAMISLMEAAAMNLVQPFLPAGYDTVGTEVNVKHVKATPVGMTVYCEAELIKSDGPKLEFKVEARDERGLIGTGTHKRYVIESEHFLNNL